MSEQAQVVTLVKEPKITTMLTAYFELQKRIYAEFEYAEDWVVIPLDDKTDVEWHYEGTENHGSVWFSNVGLTDEVIAKGEQLYSASLYTQRFLKKWIYRTDTHTMICVDTQTDGTKFLMIFSNEKEVKELTERQKTLLGRWRFWTPDPKQ